MQPEKLTLKSQEVLQKAQRYECKLWSFPVVIRNMRTVFLAVLLGGSMALFTGCQTTGLHPSQQLAADLKAGRKSILLFRVAAATDFTRKTNEMAVSFTARIGQLENHKRTRLINSMDDSSAWHELPGLAGRDGWGYLVISPGRYYIEIEPEISRMTMGKVDPFHARSYILNIPHGKPVVYAGSFEFAINEIKQGHWKTRRFFSMMHLQCKEYEVLDETADARGIARKSLAKFGDLEPIYPIHLIDYNNLSAAVESITNRRISRIESSRSVSLTNSNVGVDTNLKIAGPVAVPLLVAGSILISDPDTTEEDEIIQNNSDEQTSALATLAGLVVIGAAAAVTVAVDKTFGEKARKKWAPHGKMLAKEFNQFNLQQQLVNETSNRLLSARSTSGNTEQVATNSGLVIQVQPYRVLLRETRYKKFALEIAVRVTLIDSDSKVPLWQHDYVYSDAKAARSRPSFLPVAYETLIDAQSTPHGLDEYENASGVQLFHEQLTNAVAAIGRDVAIRFRDAGFSE